MKWLTHADKPALICGDRQIDFSQMMSMVSRTAASLSSQCRPGDRIAIYAANRPEWAIALYSSWQAHATVVPIDFMSTPEEVAYILSDCAPTVVWCDASSREKLSQALATATCPAPVVLALEELSTPCEVDEKAIETVGTSPDEDLALSIYTSGTTGSPKGVMLSFGNLLANTTACSVQIRVFIPEDRVLVVLPLHHAYPLMGSLIMPISIGATAVFASAMTGDAILSALQKNQCTFIVAVPRLLELFRNAMLQKIRASLPARLLFKLSRALRSVPLSKFLFAKVQKTFGGHLRYISCGGAAIDPEIIRDFYALGFEVLEGYGMTETAPMISFTPPRKIKPGSPGKPIPCNEVKTLDGEVLIRGANVMKGYYHRPQETAEVLDADGWLHTGDLGYVDKDGFLHLTGRSKELIILGNGKNVNPAEIEQKLTALSHGLFTECAVADNGRQLLAVVVPDMEVIAKRGIVNIQETIVDEIIEPYNEREPSYRRISATLLRTTPLPRTRLGKIRRHILRQDLEGKSTPATAASEAQPALPAPETATYRAVSESLAELVGHEVKPDDHFELDLSLDSLAKLSLVSTLSRKCECDLAPESLAGHATARALAELIDTLPKCPQTAASSSANALRDPAWTHGLLRLLGSILLRTISRFHASGQELLPEDGTPCIFAPNHQSALDGLYLDIALSPDRFRKTYFYVAAKFIKKGLAAWYARRHNLVAMDINGDLRASLEALKSALRQGKSVAIFPEGTRSMDGSLNLFHQTFAQLALETGAPIVPVAIDGALDVLPRGKSFPHLGKKVSLQFLPPIRPRDHETAEELRDRARNAIASALPQPGMPDLKIRLLAESELPLVRQVAEDVWPKTFGNILSPEQIAYMMEMMYAKSVMEKEFREGIRFYGVFDAEKPIGYLIWGACDNTKGIAMLHKCYLLEEYQGRGLGSRMLQTAMQFARNDGFRSLRLHVNRRNEKAIKAYKRNGFRVIESVDNPIGNGFYMNDFIMEVPLD